jgi:thioredoxin 1
MEIETLIDSNDLAEGVAVVKFFATWCGPCRLYAPAFARVATKNPDAGFFEVDIDQEPELTVSFGVTTVPTTIVFKDGEEIDRFTGAQSTGSFDGRLKRVLSFEHANST